MHALSPNDMMKMGAEDCRYAKLVALVEITLASLIENIFFVDYLNVSIHWTLFSGPILTEVVVVS